MLWSMGIAWMSFHAKFQAPSLKNEQVMVNFVFSHSHENTGCILMTVRIQAVFSWP